MMTVLPYERTTVNGGLAFAEWQRLNALGNWWPVIIGDDEALDRVAEQYSVDDPTVSRSPILKLPPPKAPVTILKAAEHLTFPRDLGKWDDKPDDLHAPLGAWPKDTAPVPDAWGISIAMDLVKGVPFETAHALFIPTEHSWEVPAFL